MNDISGIQGPYGPQPIRPGHLRLPPVARPAAQPERLQDRVEISQVGRLLSRVHEISAVRVGKVAAIRAAIEAGQYETPQKLEVALDRLLEEL